MKYMTDRAWVEVSLDAIEHNYKALAASMAPAGIMAVVKANAYGLGAVPVSQALEQAGCGQFAVACIEEAMELREGGISAPILTLGPCPAQHAALAAQNGIMLPVISLSRARELSEAACEAGVVIDVHIKTDVGLSRFGLLLSDMEAAVADADAIFRLPGLQVRGVFTQYTVADLPRGDAFNRAQTALFDLFCERLSALGHHFQKHSAASDFAVLYPESRGDFVRIAALLLGLSEDSPMPSAGFYARIFQIKEIPAGTPVGYGPTEYTLRPTRLAVIPVGFADGLRRKMQAPTRFMLHGKWAPVMGKVCMDYLMLDVTDIPEAQENDVVTLFGRDGHLHCEAYELAAMIPGSVGEVTSTLVSRIPRFYTRGGSVVGRLDE